MCNGNVAFRFLTGLRAKPTQRHRNVDLVLKLLELKADRSVFGTLELDLDWDPHEINLGALTKTMKSEPLLDGILSSRKGLDFAELKAVDPDPHLFEGEDGEFF